MSKDLKDYLLYVGWMLWLLALALALNVFVLPLLCLAIPAALLCPPSLIQPRSIQGHSLNALDRPWRLWLLLVSVLDRDGVTPLLQMNYPAFIAWLAAHLVLYPVKLAVHLARWTFALLWAVVWPGVVECGNQTFRRQLSGLSVFQNVVFAYASRV
jgi:hypothetical protein